MHLRPSCRPSGRFVRLICALALGAAIGLPLIGAQAEARDRPQQVSIAVRVVEVSEVAQRDIGLDLSTIAGAVPSVVVDPIRIRGLGTQHGSFEQTTPGGEGVQFGSLRDISFTSQSGQTATLPTGFQLYATPTILGDGQIQLDLEAVRSLPVLTTGIPRPDVRRIGTSMTISAGQTLAIGGLLSDADRELARTVPALGDVPTLGALFRSQAFQRGDTELLIFVTPRIIMSTGSAGGTAGAGFTVTAGGAFGVIDRGGLQGPIRPELNGVFGRALSFDTSGEEYYSARLGVRLNLGRVLDSPALSGNSLGLDFSYGGSRFRGLRDFFAGGDADPVNDGSVLLDPGGLNGMLGGGGVKLADNGTGFADHTDIRAESDYTEWKLGLSLGHRFSHDRLTLVPRAGLFYGATDEDVEFSGVTGNGFVDYDYRNDISSDRVGGRFQLYAGYEIAKGIKLFARPHLELSQNFAEADSRVDIFTGGNPFAWSEARGIERDFTSFGYGAAAGLKISPVPNLMLELGGGYESSEVPTLEFEPAEEANIETRRRDSWTITAGLHLFF